MRDPKKSVFYPEGRGSTLLSNITRLHSITSTEEGNSHNSQNFFFE
jgi:hypothetical protein